jgi:transcriptional regulator with XRE-family HTH domain
MSRRLDLIDQLRRAIRNSGQSQRAIALATGVDQANLNHFMNGKRSLSIESAALICEHLRLDLVPRK